MTKIFKWLAFVAFGLVLLFLALVFALHRWVSTDDFKLRLVTEATAALGVPVALGGISVDVWPVPAVALNQINLQTTPAITVGRLEARPQWRPLLQGQLVVATLIIRQAVLPQAGLDAVLAARQARRADLSPALPLLSKQKLLTHVSIGSEAKNTPNLALKTALTTQNATPAAIQWLPRRVVLDDVTWVNTAGTATALDGQARLAADGLPDSASLTLIRGNLKGLQAMLQRQTALGAPDLQWGLQVDVGGGKVTGPISLQLPIASTSSTPNRPLQLQARLQTHGVEVAALTAPNKPLSGLLDASTTITARAATTAGLGEALQSATTFTVRNAVLNGIDLAKAVKTVGMQRGGETRLDTLTGQITTQGRAAQLKELVASSGALTANGNVNVATDKALSGRIDVALAGDSKLGKALGGAVGIPLSVGGTVAAPQVTLERSALIGGVLGTLVLPGAGTAGGLKLGDRMGQGLKGLFGNK